MCMLDPVISAAPMIAAMAQQVSVEVAEFVRAKPVQALVTKVAEIAPNISFFGKGVST